MEPVDLENDTPVVVETTDAEKRQLSVMFCDLVGSTKMSQTIDPEDLREINRAYQDACTGAIERFGGYVARYMGDPRVRHHPHGPAGDFLLATVGSKYRPAWKP